MKETGFYKLYKSGNVIDTFESRHALKASIEANNKAAQLYFCYNNHETFIVSYE